MTSLDAGPQLSLTSPAGVVTMVAVKTGEYQAFLGSGFAPGQAPVGAYAISASGGNDIGSFTAGMNVSSSLSWTNQSAITTIDRTQPLTITWSGGVPSTHVLFGGFAGGPAGAGFVCVQDAGAGTLTVPAHVLSSMPATGPGAGYLVLTAHPFENMFTAPGLQLGFFANFSNDALQVGFQ